MIGQKTSVRQQRLKLHLRNIPKFTLVKTCASKQNVFLGMYGLRLVDVRYVYKRPSIKFGLKHS
jgi:hypothetical protein